jgi:hypothetical protein
LPERLELVLIASIWESDIQTQVAATKAEDGQARAINGIDVVKAMAACSTSW